MGITQKDIKLLWGRAASRCSICKKELTQDTQPANTSFLVGEQAHIVAEKTNGPRGDSILPIEERNSYHNLILLCANHHKIIDGDEGKFPIERLHFIKSSHELWVQDTLEKEHAAVSKEFRPASDLLELVGQMRPIIFWLHRSVPPDRAGDFLSDLQSLWHRSPFTQRLDSRLVFGMDLLLRPISSAHMLTIDGQGYARSKLWGANREFSSYFKDRGFDWDDFESAPETETILYYIERKAKEIEESGEPLDRDERNIVRLVLYIVSYCKTAQREQDYLDISEGFVRQAHSIIDEFLKSELGYKLPGAYDDEESEILRSTSQIYFSYDDEFRAI